MDLIDKKILCELDLNCRVPISRLAKSLRINRNVAAYRIKNLEEAGIIKDYISSINLGKLGYKTYKIYIRSKNTTKDIENKFIKEVKDNPSTIHFLKTEGTFNYSISIAVKNILELDDFIMGLKNKYNDLIKDHFVSIVFFSRIFKLNKTLLGEKQKQVKFEKYSSEEEKVTLDETDKKILKAIARNANIPTIKIAEKTALSLDVVKYRLKQLTEKVVNSYRIILDVNKLGYYHYTILLKTNFSKKQQDHLIDWCAAQREIMFMSKRIGEYNFGINIAIENLDQLNDFISKLKDEFGDTMEYYTILLNKELIKLNYIPF